ncbi:4'-phosphopantetheinyl transferase superfamily protein (plasmid) [Streptomyces sp. NBC_00335]|uniref:4'-phosphopantetheinyl transferase family protein n=1 Tax=unclassified Streptomyces TaxID=2593676 RepID=UPI00225C289E|nr:MULTISPECIES: 4'-phosphopantetheinyl transferase superfamily protein [unclassified Streptomyces]MCX5410107.1 4'-phosphopantetheinyl transferase superfamily protein [Streptomyces sp. NBC_00086]
MGASGTPAALRSPAVTALHRNLLDTGAVHVWQGRAPGLLSPADRAVLCAQEREQLRGMAAGAGVHYAGVHAAVRRILARYAGVEAEALRIGRRACPRCGGAPHGRPGIEWPDRSLEFNLSRSGSHWLLAIAAGRQVGVDIEDGAATEVSEESSLLVMSRSELAHIEGRPDAESRRQAFFRCWTRKEAVLKASGVGIVVDLPGVEVQPQTRPAALVHHAEPTGPSTWRVEDLPLVPPLFGAVAQEAAGAGPVVHHRLAETDAGIRIDG